MVFLTASLQATAHLGTSGESLRVSGKIKRRNSPSGFCWAPTHLCPLSLLPATLHSFFAFPKPRDHRAAEAMLSLRHTDMVCHPQGLDSHNVHPGPLSGKPAAVLRADTLCERRHSNNRNDKTRGSLPGTISPHIPSLTLPGSATSWLGMSLGAARGKLHLDRDQWSIPDSTGCPRFHWSKGPLSPMTQGSLACISWPPLFTPSTL